MNKQLTQRPNTEALDTAKDGAKRLLWRAGFLSFFVNLLMLTGPLYMLQIYDRVIASRSYETLAVITALTVTLFAAMGMLDFIRGALLARSAAVFEDKLKDTTYNFTMDAARAGLTIGDQPLKDLRQIRQFVASPALTAVFDAPWTPFFMAIIFMMHWMLGIVALFGLVVLLALALTNERMSRQANLKALAQTVEADKIAAATLRNVAATDAMG
ncbi:MAG: type I secretion system permease/ATPase, partial [Pseudomonadota bacterium]